MKNKPSAGALRAARKFASRFVNPSFHDSVKFSSLDARQSYILNLAREIEIETGLKELIEALEGILSSIDWRIPKSMSEHVKWDEIEKKHGGAILKAWIDGKKALARAKEGTT